jgi:hypothetical protein
LSRKDNGSLDSIAEAGYNYPRQSQKIDFRQVERLVNSKFRNPPKVPAISKQVFKNFSKQPYHGGAANVIHSKSGRFSAKSGSTDRNNATLDSKFLPPNHSSYLNDT